MKQPRQFVVVHLPTGLRTYVNHFAWIGPGGQPTGGAIRAAQKAGYRYPANRDVRVLRVKPGYEHPLPFDSIPLVIRRKGDTA